MGEALPFQKQESKTMASHNKSHNLARQMPLDGLLVMMVPRQGLCSQDWPPASDPPTPPPLECYDSIHYHGHYV